MIYRTTNKINGKSYVGQDSKDRLEYLGSGLLLKRAIKKYGRENFKKEIMAWCYTKEHLNFLEKFYIDLLNTKVPNGYNLADGGLGGNSKGKHWKYSEEGRRNLSKAQKGIPKPKSGEYMKIPEIRKKLSDAKKGDRNPMKRHEVVAKMLETKRQHNPFYGIIPSFEKILSAVRNRKPEEAHMRFGNRMLNCSFISLRSVCEELHCSSKAISRKIKENGFKLV